MAKKTLLISFLVLISFSLGYFLKSFQGNQIVNTTVEQTTKSTAQKKVTGIAGIFFKCKDPQKLKEWYKTHLGMETDQYGTRFEWQEGADPKIKGSIQWSAFSETTKYFDPSTKDFMINYRVENLVNLVEQLKKEDVILLDTIEVYEYGKFIHILDIEGNKIELYEPNYEFDISTNK